MNGAVFEGLGAFAEEFTGVIRRVDFVWGMRLDPFLVGNGIGSLILVGGMVICL